MKTNKEILKSWINESWGAKIPAFGAEDILKSNVFLFRVNEVLEIIEKARQVGAQEEREQVIEELHSGIVCTDGFPHRFGSDGFCWICQERKVHWRELKNKGDADE